MGAGLNETIIFMIAFPMICGIFFWVSDTWRARVGRREDEGAFDCCEHCGCRSSEQNGHDFACAHGCDREYA